MQGTRALDCYDYTAPFAMTSKYTLQMKVFSFYQVAVVHANWSVFPGRVQMTAAAFAKVCDSSLYRLQTLTLYTLLLQGLLALEGELTPILVQMVKSANTNGLLDNDCDSSKFQNTVKHKIHELMQLNREFQEADIIKLNPMKAPSIQNAINFVKNPVEACDLVHSYIQKLNGLIKTRRSDIHLHDSHLYYGETWDLMQRRWAKLEKDFKLKNGKYDISKIPDIYDCIKYDLQHNQHILQFAESQEFYTYAKSLADIVIPQEYGSDEHEKLTIGLGICTPLLKKIKVDLLSNMNESDESNETESVNRLNPQYSHGVSSPGRHVRTRLYFTSESHIHSLLNVIRLGRIFVNLLSTTNMHHQKLFQGDFLTVRKTSSGSAPWTISVRSAN